MRELTGGQKAAAWDLAAQILRDWAAANGKRTRAPRITAHITAVIVPSLRQRAAIIRRRRP